MLLNLQQTALGAPMETLIGADLEQDPTYSAGIGLGCLPEHIIAETLRAASVSPFT